MIKKLFRKLFNSLGINVTRVPKPAPAFSTVRVGRFDISINSKSGLKYCYEHCKDYGAQLTRLSALLFEHDPALEVIDIGANQGDSAALIKSGGDVPIISIEGDASLFEQFKANTHQFKNVTLLTTFLSDTAAELDCAYENVGHNLTILPGKKTEHSLTTSFSSVDNLYAQGSINDHCKLLKVDTEGFDLKIIRGSVAFIEKVKPAILFELNRENLAAIEKDPFSIFQWLKEHSYHTVLFYESDGRFMFSTDLDKGHFLKQLYDYVDGFNAKIRYLDLVVFHRDDGALAAEFIKIEEIHRIQP